MNEITSPLRLSIWRSFTPKRPILTQDWQTDKAQVVDLNNLQEEVYSWQTLEVPFDGIADETKRQKLRGMLIDALNTNRPPSERGVSVLSEFVSNAEAAISEGHVEWTIGQSTEEEGDDKADQVNALLAVTLHLRWLVECFSGRPGISVSVR